MSFVRATREASSQFTQTAVVAAAAFATALGLAVPGLEALLAIPPLLLGVAAKRLRLPIFSIFIGNLLTLYGSVGAVRYLGATSVSTQTIWGALVFGDIFALTIYAFTFISRAQSEGSRTYRELRDGVYSVALKATLQLSSILLLGVRFTQGIPVLQGDADRIAGLGDSTASHFLGLFSGVLPIVASYTRSKPSRATAALQVVVVIFVFGSGSRLLLAAVLVGTILGSSLNSQAQTLRVRLSLLAGAVLVLAGITTVYAARTDVGVAEIAANRISGLDGLPGVVSTVLGPSIYFAARNGLVVHDILVNYDIHPPGGFILGGLHHAVGGWIDPEIWLTSTLGFDSTDIGAIATPVWSGALSDFGVVGGLGAAFLLGLACALLSDRSAGLERWVAFGTVLSFYGSYLVSAQFLLALISIGAVGALQWTASNSNPDVPLSQMSPDIIAMSSDR